jgi:UDP:flavonoid glycosyltransferase YjiC (YdhE family)
MLRDTRDECRGSNDQFGNADALVAAGVARRVDSDTVTPDELRAVLLEQTGSAEVATRSAEIRRELREGGGTAGAADLIEQELAPAAAGRKG